MSKTVTAPELGVLVTQLLTEPHVLGQLEERSQHRRFVADVAHVVTRYCGGEVRSAEYVPGLAPTSAEEAVVVVRGDEAVPEDGGVWAAFDPEGDLWAPFLSPSALRPQPEARRLTMPGDRPLSAKLMDATERACRQVAMQECAADHYGEPFALRHRWCLWWRGFVAGWLGDSACPPLGDRISAAVMRAKWALPRPAGRRRSVRRNEWR